MSLANQKLKRPLRENSARNNVAHNALSQKARELRRLDHRRNARQQVYCDLLEHSPHREVKSVYMNRYTPPGEHKVLPTEGSALRKLDKAPIDVVGKVGELPSQ